MISLRSQACFSHMVALTLRSGILTPLCPGYKEQMVGRVSVQSSQLSVLILLEVALHQVLSSFRVEAQR